MHRFATTIVGLAASTLLGATALGAQGRGRADDAVPKGYEPPRGMCRVWLAGVPAAQQPAPTDCATAIRRRPENARVIFGEPARDGRDPRLDAVRDALRGAAGGAETPAPPKRDLRAPENPRPPAPTPSKSKGRGRAERPPEGDQDR
jgi:hypothetical protein